MTDLERYRLSRSDAGPFKLWVQPVAGRQYVAGIDSSGGGPDGDYAAAVVLDAETCGVVATWHEHKAPIPWGRACARLGWFWNEALLAFETFPSAHGLSACHAAIGYGYRRVYRSQLHNRAARDSTDDIGWHTNSVTKPQMIDRVRLALDDGCEIPSADLIDELKGQRFEKPKSGLSRLGAPKMVAEDHDDLFIAFAIALMVRDSAWVAGQLRSEKIGPQNETERFWAARERQEAMRDRYRKAMRRA